MANKTDGTVILIDDELPFILRLLPLLCKQYECHYATTGKDGLTLYQEVMDQNPLVISDVNLPDMMGFDVCRTIKSQNPATYVMLLTAYNDSKLRMAGLDAYADSYMDKILSDEEILLKVRNAFNTIQLNHSVAPPEAKVQTSYHVENFESLIRNRLLDYYNQPFVERDEGMCSLEAMSDFVYQSPRTFQRKMQEQIGIPFKTYQLRIRLQRGRELLMDGFSVTQITELLEFSSPSHYSRAFQEYYGLTPSKYKKNQLIDHQ